MSNFKDSLVATIKSIAKQPHLKVFFRDLPANFLDGRLGQFNCGEQIELPETSTENLNKNAVEAQKIRLRVFADFAAFYLLLHNPALHSSYNFDNPEKKNLFDQFEKMRLIIASSQIFYGVKNNFIALLSRELLTKEWNFSEDFSAVFGYENHHFLPYLLLEKIAPYLLNYANYPNFLLRQRVLDLLGSITDQKKFSTATKDIVELVFKAEKNQTPTENQENIEQEIQENAEQNFIAAEENDAENKVEKKSQTLRLSQGKSAADLEPFNSATSEIEPEFGSEIAISSPGAIDESQIKLAATYKIFTDKYDEIVRAADLTNPAELMNLRLQLDLKLLVLKKISRHLSNKLKRKLLAKQNVFYQFNCEDGLFDRKKMVQIVTRPLAANYRVNIAESDYQDTAVTLLVDNSGSMRGQPIVMSALACEIIAAILERFSIKSEILGFTTVNWRGGNSRKLWEETGRAKNPGRLSDLRHIIYKNANQTFKKSRVNLGLMLKDGILKENIDGEALLWAASRLIKLNQQRKILIVISDGTPIDDSTNSNNSSNILFDHLHQIVAKIEKHSEIELAAIAIGHDISHFYKNCITVKNLDDLGDVLIDKICDLIDVKRNTHASGKQASPIFSV